MVKMVKLFTKHFCNDENDEGSQKTSSRHKIDPRVTRRRKHWLDYKSNHG